MPCYEKKKKKYKSYDVKLDSIKRTKADDAFDKLKKEAFK